MVKKRGDETRLDLIDQRLRKIEENEGRIEKEEKSVEKKLDKVSQEEQHIEKIILSWGRFNVKKKHLLELIRASAGAFLGVGIGRGLVGLDNVAKGLAWANVIGILIFILGISALLIYKDERKNIKKGGAMVVIRRLAFIYFVSVLIEFISLVLFNVPYESPATLLKIIIVGSYTAMASAITFSLAK